MASPYPEKLRDCADSLDGTEPSAPIRRDGRDLFSPAATLRVQLDTLANQIDDASAAAAGADAWSGFAEAAELSHLEDTARALLDRCKAKDGDTGPTFDDPLALLAKAAKALVVGTVVIVLAVGAAAVWRLGKAVSP